MLKSGPQCHLKYGRLTARSGFTTYRNLGLASTTNRLMAKCNHLHAAGRKPAQNVLTPTMRLAGSATKRLIAFDFDGVVCDSVGESSISAFKVKV